MQLNILNRILHMHIRNFSIHIIPANIYLIY